MSKCALGIDFGATKIKGGIVDLKGNILSRKEKARFAQKSREKIINHIENLISDLIRSAEKIRVSISGIGIGAPGPLDIKKGIIISPPNFPHFKNIPLRSIIKQESHLPTFLDNDGNLALLGEHWLGRAKGKKNVIMLTLGTGIGGGILIDGKIYHGQNGFAGEFGHIIIDKDGPLCRCGQRGCLESLASASVLEKAYFRKTKKGLNCQSIFTLAKQGRKQALNIMRKTAQNLGIGIVSLINVFDPEMIILGGGISDGEYNFFLKLIRENVKRQGFISRYKKIPIVWAKLGNKAGILGGAKLVFNSQLNK